MQLIHYVMQDNFHRGRAPARQPTQVDRKRREVVSVGLRSCPSIARFSRILNCVHQLRHKKAMRQPLQQLGRACR